jgi:hypothetical protein
VTTIAELESGKKKLEFNLAEDPTVLQNRLYARDFNVKPTKDGRSSNIDELYVHTLSIQNSCNLNPFEIAWRITPTHSSNINGNVYPLNHGYDGRCCAVIPVGINNTNSLLHKSRLQELPDCSIFASIPRNRSALKADIGKQVIDGIKFASVPAKSYIGLLLGNAENRRLLGCDREKEPWRFGANGQILVDREKLDKLIDAITKERTNEIPLENTATDLQFSLKPLGVLELTDIMMDPIVQKRISVNPELVHEPFRILFEIGIEYLTLEDIKHEREQTSANALGEIE